MLSRLIALGGLLLSLLLPVGAAAQGIGPTNVLQCNKTAIASAGTTTTQLVAGIAGQVVNICGYDVSGAAAGTFQLVYGTGGTCTSSTAITPVHTVAAAFSSSNSTYARSSSVLGQSLCMITTGGPVAMTVFYSQF
jgi:hypothetical protein